MPAGEEAIVAKNGLSVTPKQDWVRWSARPSDRGEIWTHDGLSLNELSFYASIENGETLYYEPDEAANPLPKYNKKMLPSEIVSWFEASSRLILQSSLFEIIKVEPAKLDGHDGVRFSYRYTAQSDQITRLGEGVAAKLDGKLLLVNFVAPEIYYFGRDIADVRAMVASIKQVKAD